MRSESSLHGVGAILATKSLERAMIVKATLWTSMLQLRRKQYDCHVVRQNIRMSYLSRTLPKHV